MPDTNPTPKTSPALSGKLNRAWKYVRHLWRPTTDTDIDDKLLAELRAKAETPVLWMFGKTQSGKSSIVRYLTGAGDAEIGSGFRPCTKTSRIYPFPSEDAPALTFLDTRGVEDPGYDPAEDISAFGSTAHLLIVTLRLTDFAHGTLREFLKTIRASNTGHAASASSGRPVLLVLTCLHEAYPRQQHPDGPLGANSEPQYADAVRLIGEQTKHFEGLVDRVACIDLTQAEEGFHQTEYGGAALKQSLLDMLPGAYRETLMRLDGVSGELRDLHLRRAEPVLIGYSSIAAAAGALPVPFIDLLMLPGIQAKLVHALAVQAGQPESARRFLELSASLGLGLLARQALREVTKMIPYVGSAVGGAMAYGSTYALGRAFLAYLHAVHGGQVPSQAKLRVLYQEQLAAAEARWKGGRR